MKKVLVTGGAGFIGSHIAAALQQDHRVLVLDNLSTGHRENLDGLNVDLIEGDLCDEQTVETACEGVEAVFHLAAQISVPDSMEDPLKTVRINTLGTLILLQAAVRQRVKHLVLSSSAAVYGDNPKMPKQESMVPEPKSPYAVSKLDGEYYLGIFRSAHNLHTVSLRYFNVFGPRQDPNSAYAAAIPSFIHRAVTNQDIVIFGDGEQTRDFVFVEDVVQANLLAAFKAPTDDTDNLSEPVFNVACGGSISIKVLAEKIITLTGSKSKIVHGPERAGDIRHSLADIARIQSGLGYAPQADLDTGLEQTVRYFVDTL